MVAYDLQAQTWWATAVVHITRKNEDHTPETKTTSPPKKLKTSYKLLWDVLFWQLLYAGTVPAYNFLRCRYTSCFEMFPHKSHLGVFLLYLIKKSTDSHICSHCFLLMESYTHGNKLLWISAVSDQSKFGSVTYSMTLVGSIINRNRCIGSKTI